MANERLRASMSEAHVTVEEVADACEVDPKTVQRWLSGRRPYRRHRWQVARILRDDEQYLWPPEHVGPGADAACTEEIIAAYPHRALLPTSTWWRLFESATERIDLLGYAMLHLPEQHPGLMQLLRDKGRDGCQVRIALADPDADIVVQRDEEEQLEEGLLARIRTAIKYYSELADADGVELRVHGTPLYSSLFAFDHELLVTPHLYRTPRVEGTAAAPPPTRPGRVVRQLPRPLRPRLGRCFRAQQGRRPTVTIAAGRSGAADRVPLAR